MSNPRIFRYCKTSPGIIRRAVTIVAGSCCRRRVAKIDRVSTAPMIEPMAVEAKA